MAELLLVPRVLVGITGLGGSGKDSAAEHLSKRGLLHLSESDFLREAAESQGANTSNRDALIAFGRKLRAEQGDDILVRRALRRWQELTNGVGGLALTGHFTPGEAGAIQKLDGTMIGIVVDDYKSYEWEKGRGREGLPSFEEFWLQRQGERVGQAGPNTPHLNAILDMAGVVVIENDGSLDDLYLKFDRLLDRLE